MQENVVVRLVAGEPVWYPPGSSGEYRSLQETVEVARLRATAATRRAPLVFAVPGAAVTLRDVTFTAAEKRHIAKSLPYLLEEDVAEDVDGLHFASRSLGRLQMGVAACTHECMLEWRERLADLPDLPFWIPEPLLLPWQDGELCIVIEPDSIIVRSAANQGFSVERELASVILAALASEQEFDRVIVYGQDQATDQPLLPETLQALVQWRTGDFATALMLGADTKSSLNLRQGDYGPSLPLKRWWRQSRLVAGLFAAAFGLQLASTWADYSQLEDQNLALRQQVEAAYREVVPQGAVVDPERQLKRKLDELRGGGEGAMFMPLLDKIGRAVQAEKGAQLTSINFNDKVGDVRLNIVVPDFKAVEAIRTRMDAAGLEAQMENSNTQGNTVRARLKVKEKRA